MYCDPCDASVTRLIFTRKSSKNIIGAPKTYLELIIINSLTEIKVDDKLLSCPSSSGNISA